MAKMKCEDCPVFLMCEAKHDHDCSVLLNDFAKYRESVKTSHNISSPKLPGLLILKKEVNRWYFDRIAKGEILGWSGFVGYMSLL